MLKDEKKINIILCGGGTGGHIFPMIAIADELKSRNKQNRNFLRLPILFNRLDLYETIFIFFLKRPL